MTDPTHDHDLEVRRLLAAARHDEPIPAEVADRLDRVLAGLADKPAAVATVTDLRTRRRRTAALLVAAAAVVAVGAGGVGLGLMVGSSDLDAASPTAQREVAEDNGGDAAAPEAAGPGADSAGRTPQSSDGIMELSKQHLDLDVRAARSYVATSPQRGSLDSLSAFEAAGATCLSDAWGKGTFVPVRYAHLPAVLVFRRPLGDTQQADLFLCGDSAPVRSVTLPAP